ncbi:T9SS sorting signal type C domain-containing protein [Flavobacterium sp.]|uniref:T9SS sorting signal type C domain-containing protein n=1 Tax=Flavobacterium sp. TaxID=239 RepID=UPI000EF05D0F|nr:T9SS sorting signal type C domain-containing protein [Flavobacterium sp.]HCQ13392.1 hypothetical protein [Flavobacterium sp.]
MKVKLLLLALLASAFSWAQTNVSYTAFTTPVCPANPVATISTPPTGLTFSQMSRGSGVTCGNTALCITGSGFNGTLAANIAASKWFTFSISSDASNTFTINSLSIVSRVSNVTGSPTVSVQYSIGAGAKTLIGTYTPTTAAATYTITPATAISVGVSQVVNIFIIPVGLTAATTTARVENATSINVTGASACTPPADPTGTIAVSANPSCGAATLSYPAGFYWQTTATGTSTSLPTSSNYSLASSGTVYVRAYNGTCWSTGSLSSGAIVINSPSAVATNPSNVTISSGANTSFSVTGTNAGTYQWQVDTGSGFTDLANGAPYSNVTTATLNITGATFAMNGYQYRCVLSNAPCTPATSTAATLTVSAPQPEINVRQAATSIAHNGTQLFATTAIGSSSDLVFTIENTGSSNLTFNTPLSASGDYSIITPLAVSPVTAGSSTTFTVRFTPTAIGTRTGSVTIGSTNDTDEPNYTINFTATATASNLSDIIENTGFTYNSNIDYTVYQAASITNTANSIGVFQFTLRDGGATLTDADALGTELSAITFNVTNLANIRTAALFRANTLISNTPIIGGGTISFSGLSGANVTALDGTQENLTLRITFNTAVTDNQQLQFTVASATAATGSSLFAAANAAGAISSTTGDRNRIEVIADRLAFVVQPVNTAQNAAMASSPSIKACDVNSNTDLDYSTAISITSTGTMTGSPISVVPTIGTGVSIFSGIVHTSNGTYTLGATSGSLAGTTSSSFVISAFSFAAGDFRPLYPTDLSFNGDWEYYNGTSWGPVPDNNAPQNTTTTINRILIDKYVTGGGSNAKAYNCDFIIQSGGELIIVANDPLPVAAQMIAAGKKIEVLAGGILTIEGDIDVAPTSNLIVRDGGEMYLDQNSIDNTHPMWDGIELFESGSYVVIWDWNWSASPTNRSIININDTNISNNANGYKFGNLYLDITPTDNFTIVGGPVGIINIAENDFDITNNTAFYVLGSTNSTGTNGYLVNGNLIVNDGPFSFGASFSNSAFNHQFTINGDFQCLSNDILKIHHSSSGTPTSLSGNVTFKGNVKVASTVTSFLNDGGTGTPSRMTVNFDGGTLISPKLIDVAPTAVAIPMAIKGTSVRAFATQDLTTNSIASYTAPFTVETGGTLHFGWAADGTTPLVLKKTTTSPAGTNTFISQTGTTLISTSLDGLQKASATTGNVQYASSNKTFDQTAVFWYVGKNDQVTGDVFTTGGTAKTIICDLIDNTKKLTLSSSTSITAPGLLNIIKGQFFESATALITGSTGGLTMEDGTRYVIPSLSSSATDFIPRMDGLSSIYNLSGNSTIELNGADGASVYDQYLRGSRNYRNLTFSTSGTKTISSAISSITGTITVADAAVLNVENKVMGGIGTNLTMTGTSQYITAGTGVKPDASGTYNLGTGTKVTFTSGSIAVPILTLQQIRLAPNYYNIDIVGNNVGTNTTTGSVKIQSGGTFTVKSDGIFKHSNTAGFSGSGVTAIDNTNTPTITLEANSTIDYAGADQTITLFSPAYRNLTISGTGVKTLQDDFATRVEEDLRIDSAKLLLTINQIITVKEGVSIAATGAEFELDNNAQLIQIDEVDTNVGTNFKLKRLAFVNAQDYVYWSSPVFGFDVGLIPTQQRYFWNPIFANTNGTVGNWNGATGADAIMSVGKGYIVNCGSGFPIHGSVPGNLETNFVGRPNNGTLTSTIQRGTNAASIDDNWNLVGNPYPSAIFAEEFLDANVDKINGSVWVWTHGHAPDNATDPFYDNFGANYYATDYLKYNKLGATDTTFSGIIVSGQGFMVNMLNTTPSTTETVTFTNAMRTDATATPYNNSIFYRTANTNLTVANPEEKHRIWLSIINTAVGQKESALLGYSANSTLVADHFYDCIYVPRTEVGIYTLVNTGEYVIQGRPLPFLDSDLVPMGVKIVNAGSHKIAIKKVDGLFEGNQGIYLEDTVLGIVHDLKAAPYTFTSEVGVFNSRFIVRYTPSALSNDDFDSLDNNVFVSTQSTDVSIKSANELMSSVLVYDILGRELVRKNNINANDITLPNVSAVNQALIVKITLENGQVVTRKIIL